MDSFIKYRVPKPIRQKQISPAWDKFTTKLSEPVKQATSGVRFTTRAKNWDPVIDCFPPIPSTKHRSQANPIDAHSSHTHAHGHINGHGDHVNDNSHGSTSATENAPDTNAVDVRAIFCRAQSALNIVNTETPARLFEKLSQQMELGDTANDLANKSIQKRGQYILRFDGGSRGNPGPAGSGSVIYDPEGQIIWTGYHYIGRKTNNQAEYQGLINGLATVVALVVRQVNSPRPQDSETVNGLPIVRSLLIQGDSDLVIKQLKGRYQVKSHKLKPLHDAAVNYLEQLRDPQLGPISLRLEHIYRNHNQMADALANQAMDTRGQESQWMI